MDTKIYSKHMRKFTKKMKELGFQKWKSTFYVRKTEYDVLEEIHIQRSSDGYSVTGNYHFYLLYQPYSTIRFETSGRFGRLVYGKDYWWPLETEADCEKAFDDFYKIMIERVIPEFELLSDKNRLLELIDKTSPFYKYYLRTILELYFKNYEEAKMNYQYIFDNFDSFYQENEQIFKKRDYEKVCSIPTRVFTNQECSLEFLNQNINDNIENEKYPFKKI